MTKENNVLTTKGEVKVEIKKNVSAKSSKHIHKANIFTIESGILPNQCFAGELSDSACYKIKTSSEKKPYIGWISMVEPQRGEASGAIEDYIIKFKLRVVVGNRQDIIFNDDTTILFSDIEYIERSHVKFKSDDARSSIKPANADDTYDVFSFTIGDKTFNIEDYHLIKVGINSERRSFFGYIKDVRDGNLIISNIKFLHGSMEKWDKAISLSDVRYVLRQRIVVDKYNDSYRGNQTKPSKKVVKPKDNDSKRMNSVASAFAAAIDTCNTAVEPSTQA